MYALRPTVYVTGLAIGFTDVEDHLIGLIFHKGCPLT